MATKLDRVFLQPTRRVVYTIIGQGGLFFRSLLVLTTKKRYTSLVLNICSVGVLTASWWEELGYII